MTSTNELLVSRTDAEALASIIGDAARADRSESGAADALAEVLSGALVVPHEGLPADRVSMNSRVTYREEPGGASRSIVVVHPGEAAPADGRISVLSPVGRSLLGRRAGSRVSIAVPGGRVLTIHVLATEKADPALFKEAA